MVYWYYDSDYKPFGEQITCRPGTLTAQSSGDKLTVLFLPNTEDTVLYVAAFFSSSGKLLKAETIERKAGEAHSVSFPAVSDAAGWRAMALRAGDSVPLVAAASS